ncbi:DHA2 family efflux MFS transporter permease subunit [Agromyces agglutinans]|nr:DHA2 family efflux MFS transporter permease subunit [Agromyces agglutinans]
MSDERVASDDRSHDAAASPDPRRWKALAVLGAAFFMVILDSTIVLTAIPSIQSSLDLSVTGVQWVITGYAVAFGSLLLFFGRVADVLGRRRVFLVGTVVFVIASSVCGLADTAAVLVIARLAQGVSAAIMAPSALAIVIGVFRDPAERNRALGLWGALGGVGATAGLLLGGVITASLGWEWIFLINVPVGIAVLVLVPPLVGESREHGAPRRFDVAGAVTITTALVLLISAVVNAPDAGWTGATTLIQLAGAVALFVLFVAIESRSAAPLVPLRIFRLRTLTAGNLLILAIGLAVDGMLFPLTLYAQQVLGFTALQFGLMSAVMTGMSVVGAFAGQAAVTRFGMRPVAVAAALLIVAGTVLLTSVSTGGTFFGDLFWPLVIFGPGMGAAFVTAQIAALHGVPDAESGLAAGLVDTSFHLGGALGIAVVSAVAVAVIDAGGSPAPPSPETLTDGLRAAFAAAAVFAAAGLAAALLLPGRGRRRTSSAASSG